MKKELGPYLSCFPQEMFVFFFFLLVANKNKGHLYTSDVINDKK